MSHAIPHAGNKQQTGGWNSGAVALPNWVTNKRICNLPKIV